MVKNTVTGVTLGDSAFLTPLVGVANARHVASESPLGLGDAVIQRSRTSSLVAPDWRQPDAGGQSGSALMPGESYCRP